MKQTSCLGSPAASIAVKLRLALDKPGVNSQVVRGEGLTGIDFIWKRAEREILARYAAMVIEMTAMLREQLRHVWLHVNCALRGQV